MSTAALFESARLVFAPASESDVDAIAAMYQGPESQIMQFHDAAVPRAAAPLREMVRGWVEKHLLAAAVREKAGGALVGWVSLRKGEFPGELLLGLQVQKEHWGKGYGREGNHSW